MRASVYKFVFVHQVAERRCFIFIHRKSKEIFTCSYFKITSTDSNFVPHLLLLIC